jgi:hypothetical protein
MLSLIILSAAAQSRTISREREATIFFSLSSCCCGGSSNNINNKRRVCTELNKTFLLIEITTMGEWIPCEKGAAVWARLVGFCWWPARLCSQAEADTIAHIMPNVRQKHIAVTFLGSKTERCHQNCDNIYAN